MTKKRVRWASSSAFSVPILKTWEMGEWLSKEKAQQMAAIAREWEYRLTDRDWYPPLDQPWPPPYPSG